MSQQRTLRRNDKPVFTVLMIVVLGFAALVGWTEVKNREAEEEGQLRTFTAFRNDYNAGKKLASRMRSAVATGTPEYAELQAEQKHRLTVLRDIVSRQDCKLCPDEQKAEFSQYE